MIRLLRALFNLYRQRTSFDLSILAKRFGFQVFGVLHVGANMGQEAEVYQRLGAKRVIWVEGFEEYYHKLNAHLASYPGQEAHCVLVSDLDGEQVQFRTASNTGSSTAMSPRADFAKNYQSIGFSDAITLVARRLDRYFEEHGETLCGINVLVLDVEGYELKVLRSLQELMSRFDWAVCEVSLIPNYEDSPLLREIDDFFMAHGFRRRALKCGLTSGDGLYERKPPSGADRFGMALSRGWSTFAAKSGLYRLKRAIGRL